MEILTKIIDGMFSFAFFYPLLMAYVWMGGALLYFFRFEFRCPNYNQPPALSEYPLVSIIVPCYNEAPNAHRTFGALAELDYANYEVIAVNDGSSDNTAQVLTELAERIPNMRLVHLSSNQGKALALKSGALAARGDFLICIDGDAILDHYAIAWILRHFLESPRVGAVTGNPRIRTRSTLLGRLQVGEFSAIIGLIKRAQRVYGRVYTISGVICAFRRLALHDVGYWNENTLTEDIDISWRLQLAHWDIRFEPRALCWILMPETLHGFMKQRLRWAVGGGEAVKTYSCRMLSWKARRMWGVYVEYLASIIWSYTMLALLGVWICGLFMDLPAKPPQISWIPEWPGLVLGITCLLQFAVSICIDHRYDYGLLRVYPFIIWYPLFYWTINWVTALLALPTALISRRAGTRGLWVTTDRGILERDPEDAPVAGAHTLPKTNQP